MRPFQCVKHIALPRPWAATVALTILTAGWSRFFSPEIFLLFGIACAVCASLIYFGRSQFFGAYRVVCWAQAIGLGGLALGSHAPFYGFMALASGLHAVLVLQWAKMVFALGYFPPVLPWYQGRARSQPWIQVSWLSATGEEQPLAGLQKVDFVGATVIADAPRIAQWVDGWRAHPDGGRLKICLGDDEILVPVRPVVYSQEKNFLSFKWSRQSADLEKRLADFVEKLRGYNYADGL